MKTHRLALWLLTLGLGASTAPAASAMPPGPPPEAAPMAGDFHRPLSYLRSLHLSDAQKDQVFDILHQAAPALRAKEKEAQQAHRQLHDFAMSPDYDEAKAKSLAAAVARASAEVALLRAGIDNRIFRLLSAEQRQQLAEPTDAERCGEGLPGAPGRGARRD